MPVRKIPKNYRNATGLIATDKSEEMTAYESKLEYYCQKLVGFNLNVAKYEEQPLVIYFDGEDGKQHRYFPDLLINYREDVSPAKLWRPLLVEVKYREDLFKDWRELKPKFRAARRYTLEQGLDFSIITDLEIKTPYLKSVLFLLDFRWIPVNEAYTSVLLGTLRELLETTPANLLREITEDRNKIAEMIPTLWQLTANFAIGINLEEPLTMRSRIWSKQALTEAESSEPIFEFNRGSSRQKRWQALRYYPPIRS
jgi:hypothetical protein